MVGRRKFIRAKNHAILQFSTDVWWVVFCCYGSIYVVRALLLLNNFFLLYISIPANFVLLYNISAESNLRREKMEAGWQ